MNGNFRVGEFLVEPRLNSITGPEKTFRIEPKVMRVLVCLAEQAGEVVLKEELIRSVWADTFVTDDVLIRSISELRKVFEDDAKDPRFIQTIARSGYRLIGALSYDAENPSAEPPGSTGLSDATAKVEPRPRWVARSFIAAAVALTLVIGALVWFYYSPSSSESSSLPPMRVVPFTSLQGQEYLPSFSPDGNQIAFGWSGESGATGGASSIYVKQMGTEKPLRLTFPETGFWDFGPVWSPDGQRIAFIRFTATGCAIFTVPSLGGSERRLLQLGPNPGWTMLPTLAWSPDGKSIAFPYKDSKDEPYRIFFVSPDTFARETLTSPSAENVGDFAPAFSPNGQSVAFLRMSSAFSADIYIVPITGGEPKRLTFDKAFLNGLDWTADGREIVFSSNRAGAISRAGRSSLWRIPASGGLAERVALGGDSFWFPRISRHGNRLTYAQPPRDDTNIYRISVSDTTVSKNPPAKLIASTRDEYAPRFSPDGRRIAFQSDRSGSDEIWMCDSDGTNLIQVTTLNRFAGTPRWSPDGQRIAFDVFDAGKGDIYAISIEGGPPRPIVTGDSDDVVPSWSADGKWIYFASDRTGEHQVWKVPAQGGEAVQITRQGAFFPYESLDGKYIYYIKLFPTQGIWRVPVDGGEELQVLDSFKSENVGDWAVVSEGIYFINPAAKDGVAIQFFDFATSKVRQVAGLGKVNIFEHGIAVSPDRHQILYTQKDGGGTSDIALVENFR